MRKRIISFELRRPTTTEEAWLDLDKMASVELTSEDPVFPIESAVKPKRPGWRAAEAGEQTIRLAFDQPQGLRRISLVFEENEINRAQEFTLRWSTDRGNTFQQFARQQCNFIAGRHERNGDLCSATLKHYASGSDHQPDKENRKARASLRETKAGKIGVI